GVAADTGDSDRLALEISNRTDTVRGQELEAARVKTGEQDMGPPGVETQDVRRRIGRRKVDLTGAECHQARHVARSGGSSWERHRNVLYSAESLSEEERLRHEEGSKTRVRPPDQPDRGRLGWRLGGGDRRWLGSEQAGSRGERCAGEEFSAIHAFISFLSSLMKRQSVLWAMIFCGLALMNPTSWRRSA